MPYFIVVFKTRQRRFRQHLSNVYLHHSYLLEKRQYLQICSKSSAAVYLARRDTCNRSNRHAQNYLWLGSGTSIAILQQLGIIFRKRHKVSPSCVKGLCTIAKLTNPFYHSSSSFFFFFFLLCSEPPNTKKGIVYFDGRTKTAS